MLGLRSVEAAEELTECVLGEQAAVQVLEQRLVLWLLVHVDFFTRDGFTAGGVRTKNGIEEVVSAAVAVATLEE